MEHFTIIDGALQMPVGGRIPSSVPRAAGHPFLATAKMQKKNGIFVPKKKGKKTQTKKSKKYPQNPLVVEPAWGVRGRVGQF